MKQRTFKTWIGGTLGFSFFIGMFVATSPPPFWIHTIDESLIYQTGQSTHSYLLEFDRELKKHLENLGLQIILSADTHTELFEASTWEVKLNGAATRNPIKKVEKRTHPTKGTTNYYIPAFYWNDLPACPEPTCTYTLSFVRSDVKQPALNAKIRVSLKGKGSDKPDILKERKPTLKVQKVIGQ